jgi:hypothetical protein
LSSPLDEAVTGFPIVVFRDASGMVIGGRPYDGVVGDLVSIPAIEPGTSERQVSVEVDGFLPVPGKLDLDATTVYIGLF